MYCKRNPGQIGLTRWRKEGKKRLYVGEYKGQFAQAPPTRVFLQKSVHLPEYKGLEFFGKYKEAATV